MSIQRAETAGLRAHQVPVSSIRRRHRVDAARWALANGYPLDRNSLAVIVGTVEITREGHIDTLWTCDSVAALVSWSSASWCNTHRVDMPRRLAESLGTYLRYLVATKIIDPRSESLSGLLDILEDLSSGEEDGAEPMTSPRAGKRQARPHTARADNLVQLMPKKSSISASPS